jgi:hypothetical protein
MSHVSPAGVQFLDPWKQFVPVQAEAFFLELTRELSPGHPLHKMKLSPLGHSGAADNALFAIEDGRVVEVHLTWSGHAEPPPRPNHRVYLNADKWIERVMLLEHDGHQSA